jgi:hypothetical protein
MIAAWSVDRLGRSLQDLVGFLGELRSLDCDLYLHQQALDTSTPSGRAMFQMLGVFAEFERGIIRERVNAGLARARAKGTKLGRRTVKPSVEARIRELKAEGMGKGVGENVFAQSCVAVDGTKFKIDLSASQELGSRPRPSSVGDTCLHRKSSLATTATKPVPSRSGAIMDYSRQAIRIICRWQARVPSDRVAMRSASGQPLLGG